jgi:hypothetical protein
MYQKATALALSSLTFLGIGLAVAQAATYSSRTNSYRCGIPAPTGHGAAYDAVLGGLVWSCVVVGGKSQASNPTSKYTSSNKSSSNVQAVSFSDISKNATISVGVGDILDFTSGNSNVGSSVVSSSKASVVSVLNSTQVQANAAGTAVVTVNLYSSTGSGQTASPTPHYVTINVK